MPHDRQRPALATNYSSQLVSWARLGVRVALVVSVLSCGGGKDSTAPTRVASALVVVSGGAQRGVVGGELAQALVVRVVDTKGQPVPGQSVNFVVVRGGGHVFAGSSTSNSAGLAQERWTLGTVATDSQVVEARAVDNSTGAALLFATFRAVAAPDAPAAVRAFSGDGQQGAVGAALPAPVVAQVVDKYGNGVPAQSITFSVVAGGGSATPATATTDSIGRAQTQWILGAHLDTLHVLTATNGSLPPVRFTATPSLPASATLTNIAGDDQNGVVGSPLAAPVKVLVSLPNGHAIAGARVSWAVTAGGGSTADEVSVTGVDGIAQTVWTLGTVAGANELSATVLGAGSTSFHGTGRPDAATTLEIRGGDGQSALPGAHVASPLVVRALDQFGNVVPGESISWSVDAGSVTPVQSTTDINGEANTSLTLDLNPGTAHVVATLTRNPTTRASFTARAMQVQLTIQSGLPTSGTVGALLPQPLVVKVTGDGAPLGGMSVTFAAAGGGGSLAPSRAVTDAGGLASTRWILGTVAGRDSATAAVENAPIVGVGVTAVADAPAHVAYVSGNGQSATVGQTLSEPLVARATDQYGNLVSSVVWSSAEGILRPIEADASGNVRATWTVTRAGTATALAIAGSDTARFSATVGAAAGPVLTLSSPPAGIFRVAYGVDVGVILRDANGAPIPDAVLTWKITAGNGSFTDIRLGTNFVDTATTTPDTSGASSVTWYLGRLVGENTLVVSAQGAAPVTVTLTSIADRACTTGIDGATGSDSYIGTGMVGTVLPTVLTPYAIDTWGNPTSGGPSIPYVPNGGSIVPTADGSFRVRLGTLAGPVTILYYWQICSSQTFSGYGSPRLQNGHFTATATPGPDSVIAVSGGDGQTAVAGSALGTPLSVRVTDQYGNATAGSVTWAVTRGGGRIAGTGLTATWTLGTAAGPQEATATLANGAAVSFSATAIAGAPASMAAAGGDGQSAPAGSSLSSALVVHVTDQYGNPTSGATVTWLVTGGGGTITSSSVTDADGHATAQWTLGATPATNSVTATLSGTTVTVQFTATGT